MLAFHLDSCFSDILRHPFTSHLLQVIPPQKVLRSGVNPLIVLPFEGYQGFGFVMIVARRGKRGGSPPIQTRDVPIDFLLTLLLSK